jgi:hypothetical protein
VDTFPNGSRPVSSRALCTAWTYRANVALMRDSAVVPVVHTPYDFYERI